MNPMYVALRVHKTTIKPHIVVNVDSGPVQINVINLDSGSMRIILNTRANIPVYLPTSILNLLKGCIDIFDGEGADNRPTIFTVAGRRNCRSKELFGIEDKKGAVEVPLGEEIELAHTRFLEIFSFILVGPAKDLLVEGLSTIEVLDWDLQPHGLANLANQVDMLIN
jgi:hypothetical protein